MENIERPVYFPSVKKTAKENGLIQIGSNLFEFGLASELNESERADLKKDVRTSVLYFAKSSILQTVKMPCLIFQTVSHSSNFKTCTHRGQGNYATAYIF